VQPVELGIIQVGPVKDEQIAGLEVQVLDGPAVMGLAVGDQDTPGQVPGEDRLEFDGPFPGTELGPGNDGGAQFNGRGVNDFDLRGLRGPAGELRRDPAIQLIIGLF